MFDYALLCQDKDVRTCECTVAARILGILHYVLTCVRTSLRMTRDRKQLVSLQPAAPGYFTVSARSRSAASSDGMGV
jgi:hypothetical protein